jgi:hypothetical protein
MYPNLELLMIFEFHGVKEQKNSNAGLTGCGDAGGNCAIRI